MKASSPHSPARDSTRESWPERRAAVRVSSDQDPRVPDRASYIAGDRCGSAKIPNISVGGALVSGAAHCLETGTEVDLYFHEPGTGRRLHAIGHVVREADTGFAVLFLWMGRDLERLVLVAAGDTDTPND